MAAAIIARPLASAASSLLTGARRMPDAPGGGGPLNFGQMMQGLQRTLGQASRMIQSLGQVANHLGSIAGGLGSIAGGLGGAQRSGGPSAAGGARNHGGMSGIMGMLGEVMQLMQMLMQMRGGAGGAGGAGGGQMPMFPGMPGGGQGGLGMPGGAGMGNPMASTQESSATTMLGLGLSQIARQLLRGGMGGSPMGSPLGGFAPEGRIGQSSFGGGQAAPQLGLNIGSRSPAEIAVSTLAGLIADRNSRPGGAFSAS